MIEVLWHGRGGQGAFTAARLLGAAASLEPGRYALAFPSFGPERRGAPMRAFTKMANAQIGDRSAIAKADFVVYLDETLFAPGWEAELKEGGKVLVNSTKSYDDKRVVSLDASGISQAILGREIPNTVFLGALSALCEGFGPDQAKEAIRQYMAPKLHEPNIAIIDAAIAALEGGENKAQDDLCSEGSDEPAVSERPQVVSRPNCVIPKLYQEELDPAAYARNTSWKAGYLVSKNAGWRTIRPVIDSGKCTGCLSCYMDCPDGAVFKAGSGTSSEALPSARRTQGALASGAAPSGAPEPALAEALPSAPVAIDYDFCKGCGVCVKACRFGAIDMIPEGDEA